MSITTLDSRIGNDSASEEKRYTALIADDDSIVCQILNFALSQVGFQCDTARDGATAERMIFERDYDLVVVDLVMPNKNGHALSVTILEQKVATSIIVHTCVDQTAITKDLIFRGVDDVILKPTNYELMASKALRLVQRKRAERRMAALVSEGPSPDITTTEQHPVVSMTTEPVSTEDVQHRLLSIKSLFLSPIYHSKSTRSRFRINATPISSPNWS